MPSAHAANFFAVAAFFGYYFKKYRWWFFLIALIVGISRISVGVYYPFDVLVGGALGIGCAYLVISLRNLLEGYIRQKAKGKRVIK